MPLLKITYDNIPYLLVNSTTELILCYDNKPIWDYHQDGKLQYVKYNGITEMIHYSQLYDEYMNIPPSLTKNFKVDRGPITLYSRIYKDKKFSERKVKSPS